MRLLISGSKNSFVLSSFLLKHFDPSIQYEVLEFHDEFTKLTKSLGYRILFRLIPAIIVSRMNRRFLAQVKRFRPDTILIFKGMEISKAALHQIRKQNITLINYNLDHPFFFENPGSGNRFVREAIPFYDLHITYSWKIQEALRTKYHCKTAILPFGFALSQQEYDLLPADEVVRACFLGNPDSTRAELIQYLADHGVEIDVYGANWSRFLKMSEKIRVHGQVTGPAFWQTLSKYRVQLNILRLQNEGSHNMRSFEIPGAGGIMLAPDTEEHRHYFNSESEVLLYQDFSSCLEQCRRILRMNETEALAIRKAARKRSVESGYSYEARAKQLQSILLNHTLATKKDNT
jgi:spore maturation protein CgeB